MNREEAIEILTRWANDLQDDLCSDCPYDDCKGREHGSCDRYHALEKIKEAGQFFIKHEQDTLKEFVEDVVDRLTAIASLHSGKPKQMAELIKDQIPVYLKNFLKEREGNE